jgi:hypothetical protein
VEYTSGPGLNSSAAGLLSGGKHVGCDRETFTPMNFSLGRFLWWDGICGRRAWLLLLMDQPTNDPKTAEGQKVEVYTELPESVAGWIADAASRFNLSRSEIIQRAVEHFLGHVEEVRVAIEQRELDSAPALDWGHAKETMEKAHCPYDNCPFAGDCPVDVCPL